MENQNENQTTQKTNFFQSNTAKMIMVGVLTLFLLIPLNLVQSLISERSERKKEMVSEVSETWGTDVHFYGPILSIPYKFKQEYNVEDPITHKVTIQSQTEIKHAYFFPELLNNTSTIKKSNPLSRGLYNQVVFTSNMHFNGNFATPNFEKLDIKPEDVIWEKATVLVKTTNLKSIKSDLNIKLNDTSFIFESKATADKHFGTLESNLFDFKTLQKNEKVNFAFDMKFNGSNSVKFIPIGKKTLISLDSDWDAPSFEGTFAKENETKTANTKGFKANWKIMDINRPFAQQYAEVLPNLNEYLFGVKLIETVDEYQQNERASKYGFLVIGLTFLIFFLIQTISKIGIHIFQYTMIGLALIMFYTLLISITEHSSFTIAYIIAAISVIIMLILYSISVLKNKKFPLFIGAALTVLYSFIFVIIQLESYALLVGSIGLFLILGSVMYFSRKIDWGNN